MHDDAFLQAIHDQPDDDAPRLIYADYLDEIGDPDRAAFIRLQCRLARVPAHAPDRAGLGKQHELLEKHRPKWLGPLLAVPVGWQFRRGFVDSVWVDGRQFLDYAPAIFEAAPVRHVDLAPGHFLPQLAACSEITRLASINMSFAFYEVGDEDFHVLAQSPALLRVLTEIRILECEITPFALKAVLDSPHLLRLRRLSLDSVPFDADEGARAVAEAPGAARLESLVLRRTRLGDEGVRVLKQSQAYGRLMNLELSDCRLTEDGARSVARSRVLANVDTLCLWGNHIGSNGAWALAESPFIGGVRHLNLGDCHIGDAGAKGLAQSPHLERLEHLNLRCNYLTRHGCQLLRDRFGDRVDVEFSKSAAR